MIRIQLTIGGDDYQKVVPRYGGSVQPLTQDINDLLQNGWEALCKFRTF